MEILEDHQERLDLGFAQEEPLDRVQHPLPALWRVKRLPLGIMDRTGPGERGSPGASTSSARSNMGAFPVTFSRISLGALAVADTEIGLEQVDDGQVARALALRHRAGLERSASPRTGGGVSQLEGEPRLPTPGAPTTAATWPCPLPRMLDRAVELLDLGVPTHEVGRARGWPPLEVVSAPALAPTNS